VRLGVIDRTVQAAIILLAAVTTTVAPILFRLIAPRLVDSAPDAVTERG